MQFKTSATFNGHKAFVGAAILVALDMGDGAGATVYAGVMTAVDETNGCGQCELFGNSVFPLDIFQDGAVPFDAAADTSGDPTTISSGHWMFASSASTT